MVKASSKELEITADDPELLEQMKSINLGKNGIVKKSNPNKRASLTPEIITTTSVIETNEKIKDQEAVLDRLFEKEESTATIRSIFPIGTEVDELSNTKPNEVKIDSIENNEKKYSSILSDFNSFSVMKYYDFLLLFFLI